MKRVMGQAITVFAVAAFTAGISWSPALAADKKVAGVRLPGSTGDKAASGPGCGLGYMLFKGQSGVVPQVIAVTTNGTFGSQTFGMSTGTSGCSQDGIVSREHETAVYAQATIENLIQEMAQGGGEHVASLATLIGVPADLQPVFFQLTQQQYATLFPSDKTDALEMLAALKAVLAADPVFASVVSPA